MRCGVCLKDKEDVRIYASQFGPISDGYCKECLYMRAESYGQLELGTYLYGEYYNGRSIMDCMTYRKGKYVKFKEVFTA